MTIQPTSSSSREAKPNFLALCILWAHFQACERGLLGKDAAGPWSLSAEPSPEQQRWLQFLRSMIIDESWSQWISDEEELRRRSLAAYGKTTPSR
jgi:hypothetical protein